MSLKELNYILGFSAWWSIVIPIFIRFVKSQKPIKGLQWFTAYLVYIFLFDSVFSTMGLLKIKNLYLLHFSTPVEFFLLYRFLMCQLSKPAFKSILGAFAAAVFIFLLLNPFFFEGWNRYNSVANAITSFFLIVLCFLYFYKIYVDQEVPNLLLDATFLIFAGLFIYLALSFLILSTYSISIDKEYKIIANLYEFRNLVNVIKNCLFGYALWMNRR